MGEVYRAYDPKINREVAIKVLPAAFSSDPERLRRFEQEVQAAGKLNHPNILAVYDVDTQGGVPYVVYELLEGETLRDRLRGGALSTRRAIDLALQIANGLSAAHSKGILHRDLKPDNLFLTNDGHLKILDFGLAKLVEQVSPSENQTDVLTRKVSTDPGAVMGTVGYMSPEQVRGKSVDHRADIFSFGVVFYEMLSGRRAFHKESAIETLNAILKEDAPDLTETNSNIAPSLERLVSHCLEKSPERRFQSATDIAFALESLSGSTSSPASQKTTTDIAVNRPRLITRERVIWLSVCALLLIAATVLALSEFFAVANRDGAIQLAMPVPPKLAALSRIEVSPDGSRFAFIATGADGKRELWVRSLDGETARSLAGTDGAESPFWSPDSVSLGFFLNSKLYRVDASGGRPQVLCDVRESRGGAWNRDGIILFSGPDGLQRVSAEGGKPTPATKLDSTEEAHRWPWFLPDGRHFVFLADASTTENHKIKIGSLDSQESHLLFVAISRIIFARPGYLLYVNQGALVAQPFDSEKLKLSGDPAVVAENIANVGANHEFDFSVSDNGVMAYQTGSYLTQLTWLDRTGKKLSVVGEPDTYGSIALSPDGNHVLSSMFDADGRQSDVWRVDLVRGNKSRVTLDPNSDSDAIWSPDGTRMVFASNRTNGYMNMYVASANGEGGDKKLLETNSDDIPTSWSHDGKNILFMRFEANAPGSIWVLNLEGEPKATPLLQSPAFEQGAAVFSSDDRFIAYSSNESGRFEIYVRGFPTGDKWHISVDGGALPLWRADSQELFYITSDGKLMSAEVKTASKFESSTPKLLFQTQFRQGLGVPYAVSKDGSRFLFDTPEVSSSTPMTVVLNWTAKLKQKQ